MKPLKTARFGHRYLYYKEVSSTNDVLKDRRAALPHGAVIQARFQTAGKGRLGRNWQAGAGSALMFSVLMRPEPVTPKMALLPIAAGIACQRALLELDVETGLKWPNDVLLNGKKLVGILCEHINGDYICGMGINLTQSPAYWAECGLENATSILAEKGKTPESNQLLSAVLNHFEPLYEKLARGESLICEYVPLCVTIGKPVRAMRGNKEIIGIAAGVDETGALMIETRAGTVLVNAGEVSVRGMSGGYDE